MGFLQRENLSLGLSARDDNKYRHIQDRDYGMLYQHEFLNDVPLDEDYFRVKAKYDFLVSRWHETMNSGTRILFVRQAVGHLFPAIDEPEIGEKEAIELVEALEIAYPQLDFKLWILTPQDVRPIFGHKFVVTGMKQPDPWDWRGSLPTWDSTLPLALL